jgi:hypothetical protein
MKRLSRPAAQTCASVRFFADRTEKSFSIPVDRLASDAILTKGKSWA